MKLPAFLHTLKNVKGPSVFIIGALALVILVLGLLLLTRSHLPSAPLDEVGASIIVPITREAPPEAAPLHDPSRDHLVQLAPAPDPALSEENPLGLLPKKDKTGRAPWQVYARPFDAANPLPRIAIIVTDMGLSNAATEQAINELPVDLTLAFSPYSNRLSVWVEKARRQGFETLLMLPMEPQNFPQDDPGPYTLLSTLGINENAERLHWILSRVAGPVGVINEQGGKFVTIDEALRPVMTELNTRGLAFVENTNSGIATTGPLIGAEIKAPYAQSQVIIDQEPTREAIQAALATLAEQAQQNGYAIGVVSPLPLALEQIKQWAARPSQDFALAPVSAVITRALQQQPGGTAAPAIDMAPAPDAIAADVKNTAPIELAKPAAPHAAGSIAPPKSNSASHPSSAIAPSKAPPASDLSSITGKPASKSQHSIAPAHE